MSTDSIEGLFEAPDHEYLSFGNLDDGLIVNSQPIYRDDFVNNRPEDQATDYVTITEVTNPADNFPSTSFDDTTDDFINTADNCSLSDHNYSNNVAVQMPASNINLALLFQRNASHKCGYCDKLFANVTSLRRHVRCHTKEQPFKCQVCDKCFSQQSNLWKHIRIHTGERPFECPDCKRKFSQRANMQKHMLIHSGEKPFECTYCWRSFSQLANLNKHVQLHLGTQPYKCKYCDKAFSQRSNMLKHQYLHEGVEPFSCQICRVSFTQQGNLKKHLALHTDEKAFVCEDCGKAYAQKINLTKHKQQCTGQVLQTIENLLDTGANTYLKIIQLDGKQDSYYINGHNELIKLEEDADTPEIEESNSNESSSSASA